ncbi:MAG: HPr(Ser) kinase/phosphatase [Deltaproteobacteria bacterium]|nr:HPr(Ser) kinase/phosphatase [Deltaproteobacteria bacterium]
MTRVTDLLKSEELQIEVLAGTSGLNRQITHSRIQKAGLAAAGFVSSVEKDRVQVLGATELEYMKSLDPESRQGVCRAICSTKAACLIACRGIDPPDELKVEADKSKFPLLKSRLQTGSLIEMTNSLLMSRLAGSKILHGVLIDVFGVGILLMGRSGIGKSETALDLILRGHRLVADDVVEVVRTGASAVVGMGAELLRHHMEIRGLGIINIKDLFGVSSVRDRKRLELVVDMVVWDEKQEYDRLGLEEHTYSILGVPVPYLVLPVAPGRNISVILEVAARDRLLKIKGVNAAKELQKKIHEAIAAGSMAHIPAESEE